MGQSRAMRNIHRPPPEFCLGWPENTRGHVIVLKGFFNIVKLPFTETLHCISFALLRKPLA
jgi:hypothetical protein